jgi:cytochrome P450
MAESKFDYRTSSITRGVRELEEPQPTYHELVESRLFRRDGAVNVFRYDDIVAINRNRTVLGTGGSGVGYLGFPRPRIPQDLDGEEHTMWRRLLDPMFSPKKVAEWEAEVRELAVALIEKFLPRGEAELYSEFATPLPSQIIVRMVGAPLEDLPFFLKWKESVLRPEGDTSEEMVAYCRSQTAPMHEYIVNLIRQRQADDADYDDLIAVLLKSEVQGRALTDDELVDIVLELIIAGLDTVTSALSTIFARLARTPELRDQLAADPSMIPTAVEELLRIECPIPAQPRWATEDIDLGGGEIIREGEAIQVLVAAANLDEEKFSCPLDLDATRARNAHLSFSSGVHRCLGSHLARLELKVALEEFLTRIPYFEIKPGEHAQYNNVMIRVANYVPLTFPPGGGQPQASEQ